MAGAMEEWRVRLCEGHLSSLCSFRRNTPTLVPPGVPGDGALRGWPAARSQASLPLGTDVLGESGLFSLGCGADCTEKIRLELFGAQL